VKELAVSSIKAGGILKKASSGVGFTDETGSHIVRINPLDKKIHGTNGQTRF
jgi:hypothetical protein